MRRPQAVFRGVSGGGLALIPRLTKLYPRVSILVLGRQSDRCLTQAFALGAADFIYRPVDRDEFMSRFHRRLNDAKQIGASMPEQVFGDIKLMPALSQVQRVEQDSHSGEVPTVTLHPSQFCLLRVLIEAHGSVLSRTQLMGAVWKGHVISENALDQQIHGVRKALHEIGSKVVVKAVYGVGFKLVQLMEATARLSGQS
jgi:DNA-binding response OmpR family regulator